MVNLRGYLPEDEDVAAAMAPEDLAAPLLAALRANRDPFQAYEAVMLPDGMYATKRKDILLALAEAFAYLQREGLVVLYPPQLHNLAVKDKPRYRVARSVESLDLPGGLQDYRRSRLLPKELLDSRLLGSVLPLYLRADYETAVFRAMKEVEVSVRRASGQPETLVGVSLMRKAFQADQPLGKGFAADAERQALSDLFAGAMGYFRNSTGHRTVDFQPAEAARVILFASQLLALVDERVAALTPTAATTTT